MLYLIEACVKANCGDVQLCVADIEIMQESPKGFLVGAWRKLKGELRVVF